jgi:tartrate/fumarate subfamily iron-sulfur-dependent hydro-lyase alpha chain
MALVDKTMTQTLALQHQKTTSPELRMTAIKQEDLIQSVADAFQYISYYHPLDYIKALGEAYEREESPAAKDAIAQILTNSRMSAEGHRPICQDTGIGMVFIKVGMQVTWPDATMSIQQMIDEGVRRAYANPDNPLRASVLADPAGARKNTKDNTPAVVHEIVPGHHVEVICAAKGGGSKPSPSSPCSTRPTTWSTGCCRRSGNGRRLVPARHHRHRHRRHA